ncbi:MAG: undecaprenyl-phosphate glucose phosphotransferase [Sedimentisphaerales bacterium]
MLKRHAVFVTLFRMVCDSCMVACIWLFVFYFRFMSGLLATSKGIPDFKRHLTLTFPIVLICFLSCLFTGLYKPKRTQGIFFQLVGICKTSLYSGLFVLVFFYYLQDVPYSRKLLAIFIVMLFIGLFFSHLFAMAMIRRLRAKGHNLRYYAVIGTGQKGQQLVHDIEQTGWLGLRCAFFVDNEPNCIGTELLGAPVYGPVEKLTELVKIKTVDEVYLTLSGNEAQKAYPILKAVQSLGITVRIIPDWGDLASISAITVINVGSNILFSAADSPLNGVNIILKEVFDRVVALVLLAVFAAPMSVVAVLIKLTSKGPVFYKQTRVGMDKKEFEIIKFRTMTVDAETGPQWTKHNDTRRTFIGVWLRRISLDELPQLINVLNGQMSLVGPRPERPVYEKQFSEEYKDYMLRHKVKAGMTGWAQVHDLRGDTSLRKRLLYDMYYVRNWSWMLDIWILLRTPWHIIKGKNAY